MTTKKNIETSAIQEDYIEAVYILIHIENNPAARVTDIANKLGVNKSNVSNRMKKLNEDGYINYNTYSWITLTEKGYIEAQNIYKKHLDLITFFNDILGLDLETAGSNACRIEHAIDNKAMHRLKEFIKFLKNKNILKYVTEKNAFSCKETRENEYE